MRSAITSRAATAVVVGLTVACASSCASRKSAPPVVAPRLSPAEIQAILTDADALAARGCYVCLQEAAKGYASIADVFNDAFVLMKKTVETNLMLAIREIELRIPDSGARANAYALRQHVKANYDDYFSILDWMARPYGAGVTTAAELDRERADRTALLTTLEGAWPANPMAAYFYIAFGLNSAYFRDLKSEPQRPLEQHPESLALKYRLLTYPQTFSAPAAAEILSAEPRFAEVRLVIGYRALFGADLPTARREFIAAYDVLPQSLAVKTAMATVEFAYARYAQALVLLDEILAAGPDAAAQLTRAEALSYLKRHREAIAELNELLKDVQRNPGEKYYWRAWNELQVRELEPAYDDATTTLKFMTGADAQRLAGIASFNLERLVEARGYFNAALKIYAADCDSIQYIGQLDAAERKWPAAYISFISATGCFHAAIERSVAELAKKEAENSNGLLDGQIAGLKEDIAAQRLMEAQSGQNAAIAAKSSPAPQNPTQKPPQEKPPQKPGR